MRFGAATLEVITNNNDAPITDKNTAKNKKVSQLAQARNSAGRRNAVLFLRVIWLYP